LIDALDPLAGGMFPLGRRREPWSALARATAIVITRVEPGQNLAGIERLVRKYNTRAPIFRSRVIPLGWSDDGAAFQRVAAFCGLGAPRSFWRTLEEQGLKIVYRRAFRDHHSYRRDELEQLVRDAKAAGTEALVTTEKDFMNLCADAADAVAPWKLHWLRIGIEIENEAELLKLIL
jgi:tetraacyldisaccharide 4'-kinase